MKNNFIYLGLMLLSLNVWSESQIAPPHLGPWDLRFNHLHTFKVEKSLKNKLDRLSNDSDLIKLQSILEVSKKASEWINLINTQRSPENQLDLSNPPGTNTGGIPYQKPMKSSTSILESKLSDFLNQTPDALKLILKNNDPLTSQLPIQDEVLFVKEMRKLDRIYQATIRFIGQLDWLLYYANREIFDVRGFLFFKEKDSTKIEEYLKNIDTLDLKEKEQVLVSLLSLCKNGDFDPSDCRSELQKSLSKNRLYSFFTRFNRYGESMYRLFFTLKKTRAENFWNEDKTILHAPFFTPESLDVSSWLKQNVEAEWSYLNQKLQIDFYPKSSLDYPQIIFKTGVTAHVNEVAGNLITMEAEYPINSPDQKWTIRHEYGHVLGFEDCYLEFYDSNEKAMVYYEIDVNNIMCSRDGKIQATHFDQLNQKYLTKE